MNTRMMVIRLLVCAGGALVLAGCGDAGRDVARPTAAAAAPAASPDPATGHGRKVIVFRRVRYEGATLNVMTLYADGFIKVDVPNGGAGGAKFVSQATPRALRGARRAIAGTPWRRLSKRKVLFDRSGAYFMIHHRGRDYVAMADGMSADLEPVVTRLNAILTGDGRGEWQVLHRWGRT